MKIQAIGLVATAAFCVHLSVAADTPPSADDQGKSLLAAGKYPDAEAAYRKALDANASDTVALQGLAAALHGQKKFADEAKVDEQLADVYLKQANAANANPAAPAAAAAAAPAAPAAPAPAAAPAAAAAPQPAAPSNTNDSKAGPGPAIAPAQSGAKNLDVWYVKTDWPIGNSSRLRCTYYWFQPDGRVYFGRPTGGVTSGDFDALVKSDPAHAGTYGLNGGKLTLQQNGHAPEVHDFTTGGGGIMDVSPLQVCFRFKDGTTLDGSWGVDAASNFGGVAASGAETWTFHKDGTCQHIIQGIADNGPTGGIAANSGSGKYELKSNKLIVNLDNGGSKSYDVFATGTPDAPALLVVDGLNCNHMQ